MVYTIVIYNAEGMPEDIISFDSVEGAKSSLSGTVTSNTVEDGYDISDGMTLDSFSVSLKAVATSYNIFDDGNELVWDGRGFSKVNQTEESTKGHILLERRLRRLMLDRKVFTLLRSEENSFRSDIVGKHTELSNTIVDAYKNCVLTRCDVDEAKGVTGALFFDLSFVQIRYATTVIQELTAEQQQRRLIPMKAGTGNAATGSSTTADDGTAKPSLNEKPIDPTAKKKPAVDPDEQLNKQKVAIEQQAQKALDAQNEKAKKWFEGR